MTTNPELDALLNKIKSLQAEDQPKNQAEITAIVNFLQASLPLYKYWQKHFPFSADTPSYAHVLGYLFTWAQLQAHYDAKTFIKGLKLEYKVFFTKEQLKKLDTKFISLTKPIIEHWQLIFKNDYSVLTTLQALFEPMVLELHYQEVYAAEQAYPFLLQQFCYTALSSAQEHVAQLRLLSWQANLIWRKELTATFRLYNLYKLLALPLGNYLWQCDPSYFAMEFSTIWGEYNPETSLYTIKDSSTLAFELIEEEVKQYTFKERTSTLYSQAHKYKDVMSDISLWSRLKQEELNHNKQHKDLFFTLANILMIYPEMTQATTADFGEINQVATVLSMYSFRSSYKMTDLQAPIFWH
ncbi:hypothetical protein CKF58_00455 [Psittacicella hinzii]|uniref:Uncharacterized protein n=1 Tax=Psittacicella hinzii TaxID=2028575 RepID=A0A3A1YQR2_9GAMM|nr:hypothetical protein CKF58_00455 [Psittacicella hinzii]